MSKVWVVTSGNYSDYEYDAIFSTEEKAGEFMKAVPGDWNGADEVEVDDYNVASKLKEGMNLWRIQMLRDGTVQSAGQYTVDGSNYEEKVFVLGPDSFEKRTAQQLNVWCFARDKDHAIKIAGEKRTQSIVGGMWK